ncbi:MAG: succinate--CoA ligase subunit beta [Gammaproteobacteria bacterium]|nr:succinate--CoA ligase subunit beta [Gammaproteobacteria bacterium]MYD76300.1 succinate--CoA ligase subunit beta [Gammaproteobacteria bacterium]MYJ53061.1 succinate--CoA ligase subunit beta [Gammaproteobacteria bacterium]
MNIREHQAKRLLKACGIAIPEGKLARTPDEARENAARLKGESWMVKAQVRAGGREAGRMPDGQGGIRRAHSPDEVRELAVAMLGKPLVTDHTTASGKVVSSLYIEQYREIEKEFGVSLTVDERQGSVVLFFGERGGADYLSPTAESGSTHRLELLSDRSIPKERLRSILEKTGIDNSAAEGLIGVVERMAGLFFEKDAVLVEINPIGLAGGAWLALDAKMTFDRNALFRQEAILMLDREDGPPEASRLASMDGFNYLELEGNVANLSVGAGLAMATMDAIKYCGGEPANFLDLPPDSRVNRVLSAIELVLSISRAKSLLVNVFGGGIMRCDTVSDALLLIHSSRRVNMPMAVRLAGTNAELANRRLRESMPQLYLANNLADAAKYAVEAAGSTSREDGRQSSPALLARLKSAFGI